ncbi:MAG: phage major capsid protein [Clostridia bacterium]|nr:phage major capsid protein [Clostridia bacterium]
MKDKIKKMTVAELEARKAAIPAELEVEGADLDALQEEVRAINDELEARKADAAKREEIRKAAAVANVEGRKAANAETQPTLDEVRKSDRYINAYANYIRTGNADECRAILTETNPASVAGSGPVPVPVLVDEIVRTAWDNDEILSRVRKTYFRGNLKVAFERSATAAVVHTEGTSAPSEESLVLGIVTMIPQNIKKWIKITDEAVTMGGEAFLRYVYDELTYQIIRKLSADVVGDIAGASTSHSASAVGIPKSNVAPGVTAIATASGYLSDEARNPVIIMNRLTYAAFYEAYAAANFAIDPFMGLKVLYTNALPAYASANDNAVYAILGDLSGEQVNYPEGEGVAIKWDDLSEAEADLVKVVGRQYAAHAVTAPGRFVNITKPAAVTT